MILAKLDVSHSVSGQHHSPLAEALRALVSGYPGHLWPDKLMVTLQAYIDDSSSDFGDRRFFLAGYINSADQWISFSNAWYANLRAHPPIKYFKMVEAQNLRGEFYGWSENERDKKLLKLATAIYNYAPWSVHVSVSREAYNRIVAPVAPYGLRNPYFSCFWGVIITTAHFHEMSRRADIPPVDFVFDEQGGLGDDAALWYRWVKEEENDEIKKLLGSTPIFRDDKCVAPLQAADMLVWHLRREHERGGIENPDVYSRLIRNGAHAYRDMDEEVLKHIASKMEKIPGIQYTQEKKVGGLRNRSLAHKSKLDILLRKLATYICALYL